MPSSTALTKTDIPWQRIRENVARDQFSNIFTEKNLRDIHFKACSEIFQNRFCRYTYTDC